VSISSRIRWYRGAPRRLAARARYSALARVPIEPSSIALWGYLASEIGLGSAARGLAAALQQVDPNLNCHVIPLPGRNHVTFTSRAPTCFSGTNIFVTSPPQFSDGHTYFPHEFLRETNRIGHWYWELPQTPPQWRPVFELVDEIWASSEYSAEAFRRGTKKRVRIAPSVVTDWPHSTATEARHAFPNLPDDAFVFLMIFDFASGAMRKNPSGTVAAFNAAFPRTGRDQPYLVLKYHAAQFHLQAEAELRQNVATNPNIILMNDVFSEAALKDLKDSCDCYISLHRAEGFGLNIAEAMIAQKPVICTAYSGNVDFTNESNSFPVGYRLTKLNAGDYQFGQDQEWAEPNFDDAVSNMRFVYNNISEGKRRGRAGRERILSSFSVDAIARVVKDLLQT
jgi:hypothetical protein